MNALRLYFNKQLLRTEEFKTQAEWEETLGDEYVIHRETDDDGNVVLVAYDKQGRMLGSFILDRSGKGAGINVESGYAHASDVEGSAAYWAREMGKIRDKKPSSLQRYCGANQDQACVDKWNALMKSWNAEYRAATKQWKAADAREKAAPVKEAHYAPSNYDVFKRAVYKIAGVLDVSWKDVYYRFTLDPEYYSSSYDEEAMLDAEFGLGITDGKPLADQVGAIQQAYGLDDGEVNELLQSEEHWQNEFYKQGGENNV